MMSRRNVYKVLQSKHNKLADEDISWLQFKKREILSRITHVIDCEAYIVVVRMFFFAKFQNIV